MIVVLVIVPYLEIVLFTTESVILLTSEVTFAVAVLPFDVLTVIVASPKPTAFMLPFLSTVITLGLLLLHVTVLSLALSGLTVATSLSVVLTTIVLFVVFNSTPVGSTNVVLEEGLLSLLELLLDGSFSHTAYKVTLSLNNASL